MRLAGGGEQRHSGSDQSQRHCRGGAHRRRAWRSAAGVLTKGANAGLQKAFGKPGAVDPAAAIASTAKDSADAYAKLHAVPADPQAITGALKGALTGLDPSVVTGMSPGLKSTIFDIGQTVQNLPEANMGQINSWTPADQCGGAARTVSNRSGGGGQSLERARWRDFSRAARAT